MVLAALAVAAPFQLAPDARALEAFGGRLQAHGYLESQLRALASNYSAKDGWDLAQWYNVADLELELDVAPDGFGPFSLISSYVRLEARYDCVWTHACGIFPSVDTYGNHARRLPRRYSDGRKSAFVGVIDPSAVDVGGGETRDFRDRRRYIQIPLGQNGAIFGVGPLARPVPGRGKLAHLWNVPGFADAFFALPGLDPEGFLADGTPQQDLGRADDDLRRYPGAYVAENFLGYRFGVKQVDGTTGGNGVAVLGPWRPVDDVIAYGALADRANPYRSVVTLPLLEDPLTGVPAMIPGVRELAFRPAPFKRFDAPFDRDAAQGLYYPTADLKGFFERGGALYDQNFSQSDLAWNHGASQGSEQELKESYLDVELLDGTLWARFGRQIIVWGKTELFRAVDQFNPQDLGLASLPSLEESRVPLWAARAIYSFYEVGPFADVRLEGAVLLDQFEPADLGRCGEPYAVLATCLLSGGLLAHGLVGTGVAGAIRPADPWDDASGLEGGLRLEFRRGRFSFAISDYYGYDDLPYLEQVSVWARNVDPETGRPRSANATGPCTSGAEPACLGVMPYWIPGPFGGRVLNPEHRQDVLDHHPANQQLFAVTCASTAGVLASLPEACAFDVWNSPKISDPDTFGAPRNSAAFSAMLTGGEHPALPTLINGRVVLNALGRFQGVPDAEMPLVELVRTPATDGPANNVFDFIDVGVFPLGFPTDLWTQAGLAPYLTDAQEALLGCGDYWGNPCDVTGFDLFNSEASALFQSWPGFEGTDGTDWDTFSGTQPGTLDFDGGPICTRFEGGRSFTLPGCEPDDSMLQHPFFGSARLGCLPECTSSQDQFFVSEMAALSFNALMTFAVVSAPPDVVDNVTGEPLPDDIADRAPYFDEFDAEHPYRQDGCSWRKPFLCRAVAALLAVSGTQRNTLKAGGSSRYGRRDFLWHGGAVVALRYDKRNVLGFSLDFAEDWTKTTWALELSWLEGVPTADFDARDGTRKTQQFNLVVSADRSTFINFLNSNRTFFFNAQVFLRYIAGHRESMLLNGPLNALATFTVASGYWQDRLLPALTLVHDFQSDSGGVLAGVTYRFSQDFSVAVGAAVFYGGVQTRPYPLTPVGFPSGGAGTGAYKSYVENGLSLIRDRDEAFLRFRYTF